MNIIENIFFAVGVLILFVSIAYIILAFIIDIVIDSKKVRGQRLVHTNADDTRQHEIKYNISPKLLNLNKQLNEKSIFAKIGLFIGIGLVGVHIGKIAISGISELLLNI
ncbi:hypothetical protein [Mammaliicoccus sp. I-M35]|uniref:hypothetical protein n=1 Tax=Mammaliicoccus sp. I-M35 TaxID=2898694 RepID=UPI001EFA9A5F|nr:hypothetical protein [Mammaliicoccus sp. I-M35]